MTSSSLIKAVADVGLSDNEAKLYLASIELGPSTASQPSTNLRLEENYCISSF